ncbi:MAG TPA: hypothetical protein VGK84_06725 [Candidatus Tumulicola sp.]|jgi:hypothetical protein
MSKQKSKQKVIASRSLLLDGSYKVTIRIRRPVKSGEDYDCEYEIKGLDDFDLQPARGVDAMQALLLAIQALRHHLRGYRGRLSWLGTENDGLPASMVFRDALNESLCQVIEIAEKHHEAEVTQFVADRMAARAPEEVRAKFEAAKREAGEPD